MIGTGAERVVVTGVGAVGAFGSSAPALRAAWLSPPPFVSVAPAQEHLAPCPAMLAAPAAIDAATRLGRKGLRALNRESQLLLAATVEALSQAGADPGAWEPCDVGIYTGTVWAGLDDYAALFRDGLFWGPERISPLQGPNTGMNAPTAHASIRLQARGASYTVSAGVVSSLEAAARAVLCLRGARVRMALAGGVDPLSYWRLRALHAIGRVPAHSPRPFDADRGVPAPGEGAAVMVLESATTAAARAAPVLAELRAVITGFEGGGAMARAERGAEVARAALAAAAIDQPTLIVASAAGDRALDAVEAEALARAFPVGLDRIHVCAPAGVFGHCDGAAGALQLATAVLALDAQVAPPTIGLVSPDADLPGLCLAARTVPLAVEHVLVLAMAEEGQVGAAVLSRP
jgi:3-oxoacyl-(acyl-carrier-protein) synthase